MLVSLTQVFGTRAVNEIKAGYASFRRGSLFTYHVTPASSHPPDVGSKGAEGRARLASGLGSSGTGNSHSLTPGCSYFDARRFTYCTHGGAVTTCGWEANISISMGFTLCSASMLRRLTRSRAGSGEHRINRFRLIRRARPGTWGALSPVPGTAG